MLLSNILHLLLCCNFPPCSFETLIISAHKLSQISFKFITSTMTQVQDIASSTPFAEEMHTTLFGSALLPTLPLLTTTISSTDIPDNFNLSDTGDLSQDTFVAGNVTYNTLLESFQALDLFSDAKSGTKPGFLPYATLLPKSCLTANIETHEKSTHSKPMEPAWLPKCSWKQNLLIEATTGTYQLLTNEQIEHIKTVRIPRLYPMPFQPHPSLSPRACSCCMFGVEDEGVTMAHQSNNEDLMIALYQKKPAGKIPWKRRVRRKLYEVAGNKHVYGSAWLQVCTCLSLHSIAYIPSFQSVSIVSDILHSIPKCLHCIRFLTWIVSVILMVWLFHSEQFILW